MCVLISFGKNFLALHCNSPSRHTFNRMHTQNYKRHLICKHILFTCYHNFHSSLDESTRITETAIISGWLLCIKVLTVSSGCVWPAFFICVCSDFLQHSTGMSARLQTQNSSLRSSVSIFPLAGNTTYVHVTLMSFKHVHCAAQNNVLTIALLMLSFYFQPCGQNCSSDGFSF